MVRSIIAVIVSYVAMFVLAFIAFTCAYLIVGSDVAFKPGIYEASTTWVACQKPERERGLRCPP